MKRSISVLVIDDDEDDYILTTEYLSDIQHTTYEFQWVSSYEDGKVAITESNFDVLLMDYRLGGKSGLDLVKYARESGCLQPIIMLTGLGALETDLEAMESGADDYLVKNELNPDILDRSIRYAVDRNEAREEILIRETKYRNLFERSIDATFIIDQSFTFIETNPSLGEVFGYTATQLNAMPIKELFIAEKDFEAFQQELKNNGMVKGFSAELQTADLQVLSCSLTCVSMLNRGSEVEGYQGIIRDLSREKRNEKQLIRAEKLAMTGRLARSIAHEVRNPLTNINLALDQLQSEMGEEAKEDLSVFTTIIERNSERINSLISELLESSKPTELKPSPQNINQLMEEVLTLAEDRIQLQKIKANSLFDQSLPDIPVDVDKLKVALLNIIINAIEAMEPGEGELQIITCLSAPFVQIDIIDNGKGMDENSLSKLFDPFYTGKRTGMGLGLTSAQNIINAHGGSIDVESKENIGTRFIIYLPQ